MLPASFLEASIQMLAAKKVAACIWMLAARKVAASIQMLAAKKVAASIRMLAAKKVAASIRMLAAKFLAASIQMLGLALDAPLMSLMYHRVMNLFLTPNRSDYYAALHHFLRAKRGTSKELSDNKAKVIIFGMIENC